MASVRWWLRRERTGWRSSISTATKVAYKGYDMITGVFPYNVQITADGRLGLVNNNGANGAADGQVDTVAVIDMELNPPRVVDQVVVGDAPEGLAVSPVGGYAVSLLTNGAGNVPVDAFFHHDHSVAALLRIEGKKVRKVSETEVGKLAEGIAFSPDGRFVYVANDLDSDLTVLRLKGNKLVRPARSSFPAILPRCVAAHPDANQRRNSIRVPLLNAAPTPIGFTSIPDLKKF